MHKTALLGICAIMFVLNAHNSRAHAYNEGPWCARFSGGSDYIENCTIRSFAMCLSEIRGTGGNTLCSPNPRARPLALNQSRNSVALRPKR